ncbi:MAG: tRNA 5-methoxyuridine(34)/uridine 5-oxyacetic acid(34) synthase CmoB, partial [Gammaproteobacteria bacterium]|nr:tRNA 5-methoxyuridine(34)/uridine 5-oxyacetic acid(34) synthase CmoB [Gammaproteobacteria bacterium]
MTDNSYIDAGVYEHLQGLGLDNWVDPVRRAVDARLSEEGHGDFARWRDALGEIEAATNTTQLRHALMALRPWRKGPFEIGGITIDAEWRSDLKWARVGRGISSLAGRHVLDVGGGNGYYALQMRAAGAASVLVVDPTVLYAMQFQAVQSQSRTEQVWVVPLRLEELPLPARRFDTTFSMGVLYHQRSPLDHLQRLKKTLKPGGELILETIFLPGDEAYARTPIDRYAR